MTEVIKVKKLLNSNFQKWLFDNQFPQEPQENNKKMLEYSTFQPLFSRKFKKIENKKIVKWYKIKIQYSNQLCFKGVTELSSEAFFIEALLFSKFSEQSIEKIIIENRENRNFSNQIFTCLGKIMKSKKLLSKISINLYNNLKINDAGLKTFFLSLKKHTSLTYLYLNFVQSRQFTDEILLSFKEGLYETPNIQTLILHFNYCKQFTNEGIINFGKGLQTLKEMKHLKLIFAWNTNIDDIGFISLAKSIKHMIKLEYLQINFNLNRTFTDQALNALVDSLIQFKDMKKLNIRFCDNGMFSNKAIENLNKFVAASMKNLEELQLYFASNTYGDIQKVKALFSSSKLMLVNIEYCDQKFHFNKEQEEN